MFSRPARLRARCVHRFEVAGSSPFQTRGRSAASALSLAVRGPIDIGSSSGGRSLITPHAAHAVESRRPKMGVLDAPHQTRSSEWTLGGTEERNTAEVLNANPGPGSYDRMYEHPAAGDCAAGGCTPAFSFGGASREVGELSMSLAPGPGAYNVSPRADGTSSQTG